MLDKKINIDHIKNYSYYDLDILEGILELDTFDTEYSLKELKTMLTKTLTMIKQEDDLQNLQYLNDLKEDLELVIKRGF